MEIDVLVVGAGPSGLTLAGLLAKSNVNIRIVDKKTGPARESRAAIIHVRTLELFDKLGLATPVIEEGLKTTDVEVYEQGRRVAGFPLAGKDARDLTPFPFSLTLEQYRTEELLAAELAASGAHVDWDTEMVSLEINNNSSTILLRHADGSEETVTARWVIGADGARSSVRHALGLGFVGGTYHQTGLLADVELDAPVASKLGPGTIRLNLTSGGFVGMLNLNNGLYRLFGAVPRQFTVDDSGGEASHEAYASLDLTDIQQWFDEYFFVDARLTRMEWSSLFRIHSRISERFHSGNVFLIGDAAHIHSPAGGQGMNLGIGDAFNLGWKLALVAKGQAKEQLLDTYQAERHAIAKSVLKGSDRGFVLEATANPVARWARANLATRLVGPLLKFSTARQLVFKLFSQTWINYRKSPAVSPRSDARRGPRPGDRAPYGVFEKGDQKRTIYDLLAGIDHCLLLFEHNTSSLISNAHRNAIREVLANYAVTSSVAVIPGEEASLHRLYGVDRPQMFLVRPDGHIAHRGNLTDIEGLVAHMDRFYRRR